MNTTTVTTSTVNTKRLYIGNLDQTIDEYAIVKLFEKFGKIKYIEMMIHRNGPRKGISKGYCFLEFETKEQALTAMNTLQNKIIKGKPLNVSFAHMTPEQDEAKKRAANPNGRPNLLSMLRGQKLKNSSTDAKILAIEKKLQLIQQQKSNGSLKQEETSKSRYKPY
ncbi:hypothetical protein BD770DRAFT_382588 [Pilaira anomala]|nr:hypothetical protein BD770DRAFT_382588 [Pilaira anomala]